MTRTFTAPWSLAVKVITFTILLLTPVLFIAGEVAGGYVLVFAIVLSVAVSARGYQVSPGELSILHYGWKTTLSLSKLQDVEVCLGAFTGSLRLFGIGGLFGFTGIFRNSILGTYWAFGTHSDVAVALRFSKRTIVVTPADPVAFVSAVDEATKRE